MYIHVYTYVCPWLGGVDMPPAVKEDMTFAQSSEHQQIAYTPADYIHTFSKVL